MGSYGVVSYNLIICFFHAETKIKIEIHMDPTIYKNLVNKYWKVFPEFDISQIINFRIDKYWKLMTRTSNITQTKSEDI